MVLCDQHYWLPADLTVIWQENMGHQTNQDIVIPGTLLLISLSC